MDNETIIVQKGASTDQLDILASLYYEAFEQKFKPILGSKEIAVTLLKADLRPQNAIVALYRQEVVGLVSLRYKGSQPFFDLRFSTLKNHYGWWEASKRILTATILADDSTPNREVLTIESIAVSAAYRGKGIGTLLLDYVRNFARSEGFKRIKLEVIDVNQAARKLYEREGFVAVKNQHYGWLTKSMGFAGSTTMVLEL